MRRKSDSLPDKKRLPRNEAAFFYFRVANFSSKLATLMLYFTNAVNFGSAKNFPNSRSVLAICFRSA